MKALKVQLEKNIQSSVAAVYCIYIQNALFIGMKFFENVSQVQKIRCSKTSYGSVETKNNRSKYSFKNSFLCCHSKSILCNSYNSQTVFFHSRSSQKKNSVHSGKKRKNANARCIKKCKMQSKM